MELWFVSQSRRSVDVNYESNGIEFSLIFKLILNKSFLSFQPWEC